MSFNDFSMSSAISVGGMVVDSEYQRIIQMLRAYGIEPTGNKIVDRGKLQAILASQAAKHTEFQQVATTNDVQTKSENNPNDNLTNIQTTAHQHNPSAGAEQIAILNKFKLGLLH